MAKISNMDYLSQHIINNHIGRAEIAGWKSEHWIKKAVRRVFPNRGDEVANCGLCMAEFFREVGLDHKIPEGYQLARNWRNAGKHLPYKWLDKHLGKEPVLGIFWRGNPKGLYGHVALIIREEKHLQQFQILGANQNDKVGIDPKHGKYLLDLRLVS